MTTIADLYGELDMQELSDIAAKTDLCDEAAMCDEIMVNRVDRYNPDETLTEATIRTSRATSAFQQSLARTGRTGQKLPDTTQRGNYPTVAHRVRCWISRTNRRYDHIVDEYRTW